MRVARSRAGALALLATAQLALLAATYPLKVLGTEPWHHVASLGAVLLGCVLLRRRLAARAFLAFGVLAATILATASGFYLLYWKEGIRVDGYQDWGVFWHVLWSWAAAVFFFQHTWVNRVAYMHFLRQSLRRGGPAILHIGAYVVTAAALVVTWGPAKPAFTNETYIPLSFAFWLAASAIAYLAWLFLRRRAPSDQRRFRGNVDVALVPLSALAVITGIPLLFFGPLLDDAGLKYASKFWHVWPSILFAVLVFAHGAQAWGNVRAHWRKGHQPRGL